MNTGSPGDGFPAGDVRGSMRGGRCWMSDVGRLRLAPPISAPTEPCSDALSLPKIRGSGPERGHDVGCGAWLVRIARCRDVREAVLTITIPDATATPDRDRAGERDGGSVSID